MTTYRMNSNELQQNQASIKALETVERLLRGLAYDDQEADPRLKGIDAAIAEAVQQVNGIKKRVMNAVDAEIAQFEQRKPEIEALVMRCNNRIHENRNAITREKQQLKNKLNRDEQQIKRMKSIGMSDKKIAAIYTVTTQEEIETVDVMCDKLQDEIDRLHAFVADYPRYDVELIAGIEV